MTETETLPTLTSTTVDTSSDYTFKHITPFNTAMGTLLGVKLTLTLYSTPFVTVYNTDLKAEGYTNATASTAAADKLLYSTTGGVGTVYVNSGVTKAGAFSGTEAAGTTSAPMYGPTSSKTNDFFISDPGTFYSGGQYSLLTHLEEGQGFFAGRVNSGDPGVFFGGGDDLYETLSIEYFYTNMCDDAPEPSALSLVLHLVRRVDSRTPPAHQQAPRTPNSQTSSSPPSTEIEGGFFVFWWADHRRN